jgi:hypothetical protein
MTPMLLPPQNSTAGAQPPTDESAEEAPMQGDVTAQQVHNHLTALQKEVGEIAKKFDSFKPFSDAIGQALTEGFYAIQEQLDASAQPQPAPRYL